MDSSWIIALEMLLTFGLVVGFGAWQLWSLRRDKKSSHEESGGTEDS